MNLYLFLSSVYLNPTAEMLWKLLLLSPIWLLLSFMVYRLLRVTANPSLSEWFPWCAPILVISCMFDLFGARLIFDQLYKLTTMDAIDDPGSLIHRLWIPQLPWSLQTYLLPVVFVSRFTKFTCLSGWGNERRR